MKASEFCFLSNQVAYNQITKELEIIKSIKQREIEYK